MMPLARILKEIFMFALLQWSLVSFQFINLKGLLCLGSMWNHSHRVFGGIAYDVGAEGSIS